MQTIAVLKRSSAVNSGEHPPSRSSVSSPGLPAEHREEGL